MCAAALGVRMISWLAHHARYTENSGETEEIIEGVLPE